MDHMTPHEFDAALQSLGWKQADFCRRTGVSKDTPSRWSAGKTPIQSWVPAYLGAMQDLAALYQKYVAPDSMSGPAWDGSAAQDEHGALLARAMEHHESCVGRKPIDEELCTVDHYHDKVYVVLRDASGPVEVYEVLQGNLKHRVRWPRFLSRR